MTVNILTPRTAVSIKRLVAGNKVLISPVSAKITRAQRNAECGGPAMGMCDRQQGVCVCSDYQGSSNGSNAPGFRYYFHFSPNVVLLQ